MARARAARWLWVAGRSPASPASSFGPSAVIANNPAHLGGAIYVVRAYKRPASCSFATPLDGRSSRSVHHPGHHGRPGSQSRRGCVNAPSPPHEAIIAPACSWSGSTLTVPLLTIVLRKATARAHAMADAASRRRSHRGLADGEVGGMARGTCASVYRRELDPSPTPIAARGVQGHGPPPVPHGKALKPATYSRSTRHRPGRNRGCVSRLPSTRLPRLTPDGQEASCIDTCRRSPDGSSRHGLSAAGLAKTTRAVLIRSPVILVSRRCCAYDKLTYWSSRLARPVGPGRYNPTSRCGPVEIPTLPSPTWRSAGPWATPGSDRRRSPACRKYNPSPPACEASTPIWTRDRWGRSPRFRLDDLARRPCDKSLAPWAA